MSGQGTPTRAEHMAWAKQRALAEVDSGNPQGAVQSIVSDMGKHPKTADPVLMAWAMLEGTNKAATEGSAGVRRFIEGFN